MPSTVSEYRCLLISPSDVASEREAIPKIISKWNAHNGKTLNARVELVKWELHSTPRLGGGPQAIINDQIVDECDLAIAVFWTRLGTATSKALSGSVEEIERLVNRDAWVKVYFSGQAIPQDMLDTKELNRLSAFKKRIQKEGLLGTYKDISDLEQQILSNLTSVITAVSSSKKISTASSKIAQFYKPPLSPLTKTFSGNNSQRGYIKIEFDVETDPSNESEIAKIITQLQNVSGDYTLSVIKSKKGSLVLVIEGITEALHRLHTNYLQSEFLKKTILEMGWPTSLEERIYSSGPYFQRQIERSEFHASIRVVNNTVQGLNFDQKTIKNEKLAIALISIPIDITGYYSYASSDNHSNYEIKGEENRLELRHKIFQSLEELMRSTSDIEIVCFNSLTFPHSRRNVEATLELKRQLQDFSNYNNLTIIAGSYHDQSSYHVSPIVIPNNTKVVEHAKMYNDVGSNITIRTPSNSQIRFYKTQADTVGILIGSDVANSTTVHRLLNLNYSANTIDPQCYFVPSFKKGAWEETELLAASRDLSFLCQTCIFYVSNETREMYLAGSNTKEMSKSSAAVSREHLGDSITVYRIDRKKMNTLTFDGRY